MYGKIKESKLLNIEVYENKKMIYKGEVENVPDGIGEKNYRFIQIKDGWVIYNV